VFRMVLLLVVFKYVWVRVNHVLNTFLLSVLCVFMSFLLAILYGDIHPQISSGQPISKGFPERKSVLPERVFLVPGSAHVFLTFR
jgi:hypothetical protein